MEEAQKVGGIIATARCKYLFCARRNIWFLILTGICWGMFTVCNAVHYKLFFAVRYVLYGALAVMLIIYVVNIYNTGLRYEKSDIHVMSTFCYKRKVCLSKKDAKNLLTFPPQWLVIVLNIIGGALILFGIVCIVSQSIQYVDKLLHADNTTWLCYWILSFAVFMLSVSFELCHLRWHHNIKLGCASCGRMFTEKKVESSFRTVTERKKSAAYSWESTVGYIDDGEDRIPIIKTNYSPESEYEETYEVEDCVMECQACGARRTASLRQYGKKHN